MPIFTTTIPAQPHGHALPIRRTPTFGNLTAIVTTADLIGCYTHYWHGRTIPHEAENCEPCQAGMPYRWHSYVAAWETKTALHFIFEVTANGAEPFITYRDHHNTLRGCLFQAKRWKEKPNGRILIQAKPADLAEVNLPAPPDMEKCLATLWSLGTPDPGPKHRDPEKRTAIAPIGPNGRCWNPQKAPPVTEKPA